jgi:hypothetical protein
MSKFGKNPNLHRDPCKALPRCASIAALVATVAAFAIGAPALAQASELGLAESGRGPIPPAGRANRRPRPARRTW